MGLHDEQETTGSAPVSIALDLVRRGAEYWPWGNPDDAIEGHVPDGWYDIMNKHAKSQLHGDELGWLVAVNLADEVSGTGSRHEAGDPSRYQPSSKHIYWVPAKALPDALDRMLVWKPGGYHVGIDTDNWDLGDWQKWKRYESKQTLERPANPFLPTVESGPRHHLVIAKRKASRPRLTR